MRQSRAYSLGQDRLAGRWDLSAPTRQFTTPASLQIVARFKLRTETHTGRMMPTHARITRTQRRQPSLHSRRCSGMAGRPRLSPSPLRHPPPPALQHSSTRSRPSLASQLGRALTVSAPPSIPVRRAHTHLRRHGQLHRGQRHQDPVPVPAIARLVPRVIPGACGIFCPHARACSAAFAPWRPGQDGAAIR